MLVHDPFDDHEAQSGSLAFAFSRIKRLEYSRQRLGRNARPTIRDADAHKGAFLACFHGNLTAPTQCLHRVVDDVRPHLVQLVDERRNSGHGAVTSADLYSIPEL